MNVVVVGADRWGWAVSRWLVAAGHEISVVDSSRRRCIAMDEAFGRVSVLGSCADRSVLEQAGVDRADMVIATTKDDGANLVVCQIAKHRFNVPTTVSVVNRSDHVNLFSVLDVDVVVDVPGFILSCIQEKVEPFSQASRT